MYKGYTEWIMKLFAVMAIQIDFSLSFTVYFVSELSRIRSAHHKDAEGSSGKGDRKGLGGAVRVQEGSIQVPFAFGARNIFPVRFGKTPPLGELNLSRRKKAAMEKAVGFDRILRERVVKSSLCQ